MGNKRPSQPQSSSSISPLSKPKKNKSNLISKKKTKKKEENLRAKAALHLQQQQELNRDGDHRPILRPKVYITDISNFKTLVQELTGNGAVDPVAPQWESSPSSEIFESESESVDASSSSVDSSVTASFNQEEMNNFQPYGYYDDQMGLYSLEETRSNDMLACQADLEALLEDMDQEFPLVFETNYSSESRHQIHYQQYYREEEQEADLSIYDYDFSGVVCDCM
ncbi:unnamed protein product [Linum trigynum]